MKLKQYNPNDINVRRGGIENATLREMLMTGIYGMGHPANHIPGTAVDNRTKIEAERKARMKGRVIRRAY